MDPFFRFDWYFADASRGNGARYQALAAKPKETEVLGRLIEAHSLVHFALWSELPKGHPVADLWLETETDLQSTIYLAYGGFFRQALIILRAWFEIAVHGVFFSAHYGQPTGRYELWRKGQRECPAKMRQLAEALASRKDKLVPVDQETIFKRLDRIYSFLSQQSHAQGLDIYRLQDGRDNVPRYLEQSFDIWFGKVFETFDTVCFLYRVFLAKELTSYFAGSKAETQRAEGLAKDLAHLMSDFGLLVQEVTD